MCSLKRFPHKFTNGGAYFTHPLLLTPPNFFTFRHHCIWSMTHEGTQGWRLGKDYGKTQRSFSEMTSYCRPWDGKNFQTFSEVKIDINQVNLKNLKVYKSLKKFSWHKGQGAKSIMPIRVKLVNWEFWKIRLNIRLIIKSWVLGKIWLLKHPPGLKLL